ncbi:MAG: T9SS type A sorting domain-containing protein [Candidatus Marinimicrobia bacterium]|nr:T9SS type A sorting domain-containing protein [Candidatus Neomarinimicrobiota bacterium]
MKNLFQTYYFVNLYQRTKNLHKLVLLLSFTSFLFALGEYEDNPQNPVFRGGGSSSWDGLAVVSPNVHSDSSGYKMWYIGRRPGNPREIGYATSVDGVEWNSMNAPVMGVGNSGEFDSDMIKFTVLKDDSGYKMWYTGLGGDGVHRIGLATSEDGISWSKYPDNPIIVPGGQGTWNSAYVSSPNVVKQDDIYMMYSIGIDDAGTVGIGLSYSTDGVIWDDYENNPVMQKDPELAWEAQGVTLPSVIKKQDGGYLMTYTGRGGDMHQRVGFATSDNGIDWQKDPGNPYILPGPQESWNDIIVAGPTTVEVAPDQYKIWFTGNNSSTTWKIGHGDLFLQNEDSLVDGLIASYPFNGNANDASGNGNDGAAVGNVDFTAMDYFGNQNQAVSLSSVEDVIEVPTSASLAEASEVSIAVTLKWNPTPNHSAIYYESTSQSTAVRMFLSADNDGSLRLTWRDDTQDPIASRYEIVTGPVLVQGEWADIVAVWDANNDEQKIYVNGELVFIDQVVTENLGNSLASTIRVGGLPTPTLNYFDGSIDDLQVYEGLLSAEEVSSRFAALGWADAEILTEVNVGSAHGVVGESVLVPVNVVVYDSVNYRSAELNFSGYSPGLTFIGVETTGTMSEALGWSNQFNESEGVIYTAFAGVEEITGAGVFCYLEFSTDAELCTEIPINVEYAKFNSNEDVFSSGGFVTIVNPPIWGDVDGNDTIEALDASDILIHALDDSYLECQELANADVYADGIVDGMDASFVLRYLVQLESSLPVYPSDGFLASGVIETIDQEAIPNASLTIPFNLSNGSNIFSFEGELQYDPSKMIIDTGDPFQWPSHLNGFMKSFHIDEEAGRIRFIGVGANPEGESGQLLSVNFTLSENNEIGTRTDVTLEYMKFNSNHVIENISAHVDVAGAVSTHDSAIPTRFILSQNYPNPFNPNTTINYDLPEDSNISLIIYDIRGKRVRTLKSGPQNAGYYKVNWDGKTADGLSINTGIYFARLEAGDNSDVIKMLFLK